MRIPLRYTIYTVRHMSAPICCYNSVDTTQGKIRVKRLYLTILSIDKILR